MADTKITALTENTAPIATDILPMVDDPSGTPATQKTTITNLFTNREIVAPTITTSIVPTTTGVVALGSSSSMFTNAFLASGGKVDFNNGDVTLTHSSDALTIAGGDLILAAGTTVIAPLKFQSGTNLTTAEAGAFEYDGKVIYSSHDASARGVNIAEHVLLSTANYTIPTEGGGLRKMFNSPSNVTLKGNTTYFFECTGVLSSLSATSGTLSFGLLGTASTTLCRYIAVAAKQASAGAAQFAEATATSITAITGATTVATARFLVRGTLVVDTGGTVIPAIGHSVVANPIVANGATFRIWPIGNSTVTSVGPWA